MSDTAVQAEGLTKVYGTVTAVDHLDFTIRRGELFILLGRDGAGKTTTLQMISGRVRPSAGVIRVLGLDVRHEAAGLRGRLSHFGGRSLLQQGLSLEQNIRQVGELHGLSWPVCRGRWAELSDRIGLYEEGEQLAQTLPAGALRRASLLLALLSRPEVLLADEPTAGVDLYDRERFWEVLKEEARRGTTVICTTHRPQEAEGADHVAVLERGRILAQGSADEIRQRHVQGGALPAKPALLPMEDVYADLLREK